MLNKGMQILKKVLVYYAHPAHRYSRVNKALLDKAKSQTDVTVVDLYEEYPRFRIDIDAEQDRMRAHDVILFQFPIYWYSAPSLIKEFLDLVLEPGFAYGGETTELTGKTMGLAVSTAGGEADYSETGYQTYPLRTFLTPFEQTARLCKMSYLAPFAHFSAHNGDEAHLNAHVQAYGTYLSALRDETMDIDATMSAELLSAQNLPVKG